jgi:Flp pilus assembly protein TadD/2-polyprenyl-3-methyl-5-hydroxy-6-metoxy-1,4-benzoquinol methylase
MPSNQEINTLVALFAEGRYTETATLAEMMTERFPLHEFGWKVLGATFQQMGRSVDALVPMQKAATLSPNNAEAHINLGIILSDIARLDEAEASFRKALQIKPGFADAHYNLGIILMKMGRLDEAGASFRKALQIKPGFADAHYNLGIILMKMGRLGEAETSYRKALQIKPDYAEAQSNLGATLKDMGRLDEAETSYRKALQIKPDYAEAQSNLGVILQDMGRLDEAEASYRRALEIKPDFVEVLINLALLLIAQGKSVIAINIIQQSLQIKETDEAKSIFVDCVKYLSCTQDDSEFRAILIRAITEPWGRPSDLVRISIDFIKLDPDIYGCMARAAAAWPMRLSAQDLFGSNGLTKVSTDPLLCSLLTSALVCDIEMERFLTMARREMLELATTVMDLDDKTDTSLSFYCAIARQCFINEYVFSCTDEEIKKARDLKDSLVEALEAETQIPAIWIVAVAAYFPLCSLSISNRLLDRKWPEIVWTVLVQQVSEPEEEMQLRATIPRLTDINEEVSLKVQSQYEENPYPRWVKAAPAVKKMNVVGYLSQSFPLATFNRHVQSSNVDILIAGCGTGQQPIQTALQFQENHLLAVDLSISSLSYAKRKTQEMGLSSIEYAQADILKLGSLGRSFDVIESVGVLHHLADPWAGWQVLLSLLRPDGFMRLGFYSEVARRNIVRIRAFIADNGYGSTVDDIRRCRQDLANLDKEADFENTLQISDFFSISTCRDLLFHVQEHRMSLTSIDSFIQDNRLVFIGFEMDHNALNAYKLRFPDDHAATDLKLWQIFENENPDTFLKMYQFWVQKVG